MSTIKISATGGTDKNGYYGGNLGNGGDGTIPSLTTSTITDQFTFAFPSSNPFGLVPVRIASTVASDFEDYFSLVSGNGDSLYFWRSDTDFIIQGTNDLYIRPADKLFLDGDSVRIQNVATAWDTENTFLVQNTQGYIEKREVSLPLVKRTTSDIVNSAVTAADITGLSQSVLAGERWEFEATIYYNSAISSTAIKLAVGLTGGTGGWSGVIQSGNVTAQATASQDGTLGGPTSGIASPGVGVCTISGIYTASSNATMYIRFASEAAASDVTVLTGSKCVFTKL